ncbi:uncharacterized protein LOC143247753 isoform X2 [Tachypleus tridentatus]|uniref:uncharacterized protein LOC143247753 isoform X2 n=1 Tax=Tachypleus tridentatus TaxID=6853 RepID=UPI003FD00B1C
MTEDKKLLFTYSANTDDKHCINPVRGELQLTGDKPGEMVLKYVRFNSRVEEKFQVIYLDKKYETAVAYACYRHLSDGKRCDPRALYAAILSRKQSSQLPSDLTLVTQHLYIDRDLMIPQRPYNCDLNHYEPDDELDSEQSWEPELCHEHPERGHCDQSQVNYYYSPLSGQCETFLYSGCGGNRNNFISLQECQQQCVDKTGTFMCPDTATCALTCPLCCEEENGCIECNCGTETKEVVHSSPVPHDKLPFDPDCLGSPNDCPETCDVIEFNVGCYKCDCYHSNVSEVDMVEESNVHSSSVPQEKIVFQGSEIVYSPSVPQDKLPFDPDCLGSPNDCPETCVVIEFNVGCYKCDCNNSQINMAEAGPQIVHSSPSPQDKLPFDQDCLGSPNDCPETCDVIEFNVGCYKCNCNHSNVSEVDMVEESNVHSPSVPQDKLPFDPDCLGSPNDCPETCVVIEFNVGCYKCDCNHSQISMAEAGPQVVHSSPSPQDKLPFDPDCLGSPNDCPETCDVIEFNVGCYKCNCYHSNVSEVDMVEESNVHSPSVPQDKLPFDPDCLGSPNDCPETCVVIEFNVGCYKCDCNNSQINMAEAGPQVVHSSPSPQDKLPFDPDCLGSPNDCPETCDVIEFNVGCYKCDCYHSNVSEVDMVEKKIVHSSPAPQNELPFDQDCLGSPNDCPETCVVIEFNVGCYKCDCNHSNDTQVNMTAEKTTTAEIAHYEDIYPVNKASECLSSCRVTSVKKQLLCICNNLQICHQPKKAGFCRARKPRYYYNPKKGKCELFYYGGCGGNANRFTTFEECEDKCLDRCDVKSKEVSCSEEAHKGNYYFDLTKKLCFKLPDGRCTNGINSFDDQEQCIATCEDRCNLPKKSGPCKGSFVRYFHNSINRQCEKFYFSGCGGNTNNFLGKEECEQKCGADWRSIMLSECPINVRCKKNCVIEEDLNGCLKCNCNNLGGATFQRQHSDNSGSGVANEFPIAVFSFVLVSIFCGGNSC